VDRRCRVHGITFGAVELLVIIGGTRGATSYALSKAVGREHHSIIEMTNRMADKGWIEREDKVWGISSKGNELLRKVLDSGTLLDVMNRLDDKEVERVEEATTALRQKCMDSLGMLDEGPLLVDAVVGKGGGKSKEAAPVRRSKGRLVKRGGE